MATNEERMQILKMLEGGQITADEAARLLSALDASADGGPTGGNQAKWFRVRVTDTSTGRSKVNVSIPMSLLSIGLKIGTRFAPDMESTDVAKVIEAIRGGAQGRVMDIEDNAEGERVEIFVE